MLDAKPSHTKAEQELDRASRGLQALEAARIARCICAFWHVTCHYGMRELHGYHYLDCSIESSRLQQYTVVTHADCSACC